MSFNRKHAIVIGDETIYRYGGDSSPLISYGRKIKKIPFSFTIKLPKPLRTGIDYGFLPGSNISQKWKQAKKNKKAQSGPRP